MAPWGAARGGVRARASAGLVTAEVGDERFTAAELLKAADEALYEAKRAGGERLVVRARS
jgi:PleD family two-component response regulator